MGGKEKDKRLSVNAVNLFVTCLFLFFAVQFSDGGGGFATKINKITANLYESVSGLDRNATFSNFTDDSVYLSSTSFNTRGMAGLYNLTRMFINVMVPEDILMADILLIDGNNQLQVNNPDPGDTFSYYRKLVAVVLFLALCVVLFLLCGLCFCCCRCCGNCGARSQPADKKKDTCKKIVQGTLLIVLGTGLLFCVVCAFGSNQQLQDGIKAFPGSLKNGVDDTKTFLDSTNSHVRHLLVNNYQEFSDLFLLTINNCSDYVTDQLESYSNATAMTELYKFTQNIVIINTTLTSLKDNSNKLRVFASQLNDALRKVKRDLLKTLIDCKSEECNAVKANINTLTTNIDFNALPDLSDDISSLSDLNIKGIQEAAEAGQNSLRDVETQIRKALQGGTDAAKDQITIAGQTIEDNLNSVTQAIDDIRTQTVDQTLSPYLDDIQNAVNQYGEYQYYIGLAVSCILLLVTVCIAFGLICGICGKRPDGYSDNCCNKGAGSQFLICAVMIMFFFGFILSVVTIVGLLVGVISEKAICEPIRNPDPNQFRIIKLLDTYNLNMDLDVKASDILNNCYQNKSVYTTFNIKSKFDLDKIISQFDISEQLNQLNVNDSIPKGFVILDEGNMAILEGLLKFSPTENLDKFSEELKDNNFTNYSLTDLANKLQNIIDKLSGDASNDEMRASIRLSILHLNTYNEKLLVPMKDLANTVVDNADQLELDLKMGHPSFTVAIQSLLDEISSAQKILVEQGPADLTRIAEEFKRIITGQINSYLDRVSLHIQHKVGQCGPLSLVINSTVTSTCSKILMPLNGFWFSLFWTVILYVLVIIVCIKLASLYQKYKPYGQYVETRAAKKGKKKGRKTKRYEERPISNEVAREYAAGSRPPDGRYADMAPKHWEEFPNGGPPHYQRAPTEYERPPPYYYPGNGGEQ